ncbi:hypothetical protein ACYSUO_41815 [Streptomyces sp. UC4497]
MTRSDKWPAVALAGMLIAALCNVMTSHTGWARVFWPAVAVHVISYPARHLYRERRTWRAERQALLTRLDRLLRDEVRRR